MKLFRRRPPRLPDFIGIGAMRSGTSWLRKQLERHPGIWMAEPKELHFFDRHFTDSPADYAEHFNPAPPGSVAGEITPAYAVLDDKMIATVRRWMPEVFLLFMMRDPVERAWSHARKDFPQFRGKPVGEATPDELIAFAEQPQVARRGDYLGCIRRWESHFDPARIWCGFLEEAADDPLPVLRDLFGFLGVDAAQAIDRAAASKRENARPEATMPEEFRQHLQATLYRQNAELEELLGRELPWA